MVGDVRLLSYNVCCIVTCAYGPRLAKCMHTLNIHAGVRTAESVHLWWARTVSTPRDLLSLPAGGLLVRESDKALGRRNHRRIGARARLEVWAALGSELVVPDCDLRSSRPGRAGNGSAEAGVAPWGDRGSTSYAKDLCRRSPQSPMYTRKMRAPLFPMRKIRSLGHRRVGRPAQAGPCWSVEDHRWFDKWPRYLPRPLEEVSRLKREQGLRLALHDPALFGDSNTYANLFWRLYACGMVRWAAAGKRFWSWEARRRPSIHHAKTRIVNVCFMEPIAIDLPTTGSFTNMEASCSDPLVFAAAGIKDCFLCLDVPSALSVSDADGETATRCTTTMLMAVGWWSGTWARSGATSLGKMLEPALTWRARSKSSGSCCRAAEIIPRLAGPKRGRIRRVSSSTFGGCSFQMGTRFVAASTPGSLRKDALARTCAWDSAPLQGDALRAPGRHDGGASSDPHGA